MTTATKRLRRTGTAGLAALIAVSGAVLATAGSAGATSTATVTRIAGTDRYDTAAQLASKAFPAGSTSAILASGAAAHFPDALAGNYLAGSLNAPVLLTASVGAIPTRTMTELSTLHPTTVYILGDVNAVPAAQETALTTAGYITKRLGGTDRYATAKLIAEQPGLAVAGTINGLKTAIVVNGQNFPDALAAGSLAFARKLPIIITTPTALSPTAAATITDLGIKQVIIGGSTASVSTPTETAITALGAPTLFRAAGTDRANTSQLLADWEILHAGFSSTSFTVATGDQTLNGADALAAGPFAGSTSSPILVTDTIANAGAVTAFATSHATTETAVTILGGVASVSAASETAITTAVRGAAGVSATTRPELVATAIVSTTTTASSPSGTVVSYTFDEPVVAAVVARFKVFTAADVATVASSIVSDSGSVVQVLYVGINTTTLAGVLSTATVMAAAVTDLQGQTNPEGAAGIGAASSTGSTALPAGVTTAPDITNVGVRPGANGTDTFLDLTFDQPATVVAPASGAGYTADLVDGTSVAFTGPIGTDTTTASGGNLNPGGNTTSTITVKAATVATLTTAQIARVIVTANTVKSNATTPVSNPLEAAEVTNNGITANPDLLSAQFQPSTTGGSDVVIYTFDQPVGIATLAKYEVYDNVGVTTVAAGSTTINPSNANQVSVTFANGALANAVGAITLAGAATASLDDERGVAGTSGTSGQTPKVTAGPDLKSVALVKTTDTFGNSVYTATYTFDQKVDSASLVVADFKLWESSGTLLTGTTLAATPVDTATGTVVTVTGFLDSSTAAAATAAAMGSATLGTVVAGGVGDATTPATKNPEGSAFTTGGTGTPAT